MKTIDITIEGPLNAGKSTVAIAVRDLLKAVGFDVSLNDDGPLYYPEQQAERLKCVATKSRVVIHAVTARRFS